MTKTLTDHNCQKSKSQSKYLLSVIYYLLSIIYYLVIMVRPSAP